MMMVCELSGDLAQGRLTLPGQEGRREMAFDGLL